MDHTSEVRPAAASEQDAEARERAMQTGAEPQTSTPQLPASFFSKLVHQPSCLTKGVCNNCGRCEH